MTTEPQEQQPTWGSEPTPAQQAPRPRWSGRKTAAAVGIAVVIAAGGGAAIWAATANDTGTGQRGPGGFGGPGGGPGGGRFLGMGALDSALHGEFVIADGTTELLQTGKVTQVSATSIGLSSTDGYTKTYTIDGSTLTDTGVKTGDEVTVIAKKSDNVAVSVVDRANLPQDGAGRRGQPPQAP